MTHLARDLLRFLKRATLSLIRSGAVIDGLHLVDGGSLFIGPITWQFIGL